jgi:hypothetical protein
MITRHWFQEPPHVQVFVNKEKKTIKVREIDELTDAEFNKLVKHLLEEYGADYVVKREPLAFKQTYII